eukprot:jgi/Tetstr1/422254/TSEL_001250.t1
MTAATETRHWNPEAHIGDDRYVLPDVKAAVAERGANAPRSGQRGANAPRPAQRGANAPRPAQRGANTPRPAQRGANAQRPAQRGANAPRPAQRGANAPTRGDRRMLQRHARQLYGKLWGKSRTVTSLICVDYGYVEQDAAEELLACPVRIEDGIRKRKALKAAAPADMALMAKIQAVANVQDYNRHGNKAKGRRKCSKCGSAGHNRATCPKREPAQENLPPLGPTAGDGAPATSAAAGAAP